MLLLYNLLLTLLAPLWVPWMLWRTMKRGENPNGRERRGDYRDSIPLKGERPRLWVHAVSVGEFVAVQPLLRALRKVLPTLEIVLSVTTSSGHRTARDSETGLFDYLVYLPIDVAPFTFRAMRRVRPDALLVMETELWMNLFWAAESIGAKTFVVNARLSDRSYPRAKRIAAFYRTLLRKVARVLAQSEADAERFRALGASNVEVAGNLKFDQALDGLEDRTDWQSVLCLDDRPVVVVGSLRAEEFSEIAEAIVRETEAQWIVAPRHLERTPEFVEALNAAEASRADAQIRGPLSMGFRSKGTFGRVLILDTYGELSRVYRIADLAVIGGTFAKIGMQNPIQPMAFGKPVVHGPYTQNFRDVAELAEKAGATLTVANGIDLASGVSDLLHDPVRRERMGEAARRLVEENRGAAERMAQSIRSNLRP